MKLVCPGCLAKYSVSDEKVPAALERARCRKCGGGLALIEGTGGASIAPREEPTISASMSEDSDASSRRARRKERDMFSPPALGEVSNLPSGVRSAGPNDAKLKGQRNDTSVLFSLGALSKETEEIERAGHHGRAEGDGSGLIDIRALSAAHGTKSAIPMPTVDDLVNLGGSGLATSPLLSAPTLDAPSSALEGRVEGREGKRGVWIALAAGGLFFLGAVVLAIVATRPLADPPRGAEPARTAVLERDPSSAQPPTTTAAAPLLPPVVVGPAHESDPAKATPTPEPAKNKPSVGPKGVASAKTEPTQIVAPPTTPTPPTVTPPASGALAPFNRGAASASLASIAFASCKKPDGPSGPGHVVVTFDPSGSVQSAIVDQGSFVGTPVGGCIAGKFRGAHVPAFSGGPMKVGKSISL